MCLSPIDNEVAYESSRPSGSLARRNSLPSHRRRLPMATPHRRRRAIVEDDGPRVTFNAQSECQVQEITTALSHLGDGGRQQLWYNSEDIRGFRRQAQAISKRLRDDGVSGDEEDDTRGLELRTSLQRQDRKHMIVRKILDAQDEDSSAEELAQIAKHHSVWSQKVALAQAHKDYYAAYHPTLTSVLPDMPALLDCHRDLARNKRSLLGETSLEQTGRRVRLRMF